MDLKDVSVFVRVAESADFSAAARSMNLTPSAVSRAVARLEDHLGRRLMQRSTRTMGLTLEGEIFLETAQRILVAVDEAEAAGAVAATGILRVRCVPAFAHHQIAPAMPSFQADHPDLRVEFTISTERSTHLDEGADVAITSGMPPVSNLMARRFSGARWVTCASRDYVAARGLPTAPSDLARHIRVDFPVGSTWHCSTAGGEPPPSLVANQAEMLQALARAGAGIARLPEYAIAEDLRRGDLVRLPAKFQDEEEEEPLYILHHARRHVSPRIRAFLDFLDLRFGHRPWRNAG